MIKKYTILPLGHKRSSTFHRGCHNTAKDLDISMAEVEFVLKPYKEAWILPEPQPQNSRWWEVGWYR